MEIDVAQAERFLQLLDPNAEAFTFRTLDDKRLPNGKPRDQANLRQDCHGPLSQHLDQLTRLNTKFGAAIYVTINRTDLHGHKQSNITGKRAAWCDLDRGQPQHYQLKPSIVVQTSPGKFQAYWLFDGELSDADFLGILRHLALTYGGDPGVNSIERILRIPGFWHQKGEPHQVSIVEATGRRYSIDELVAVHPPLQETRKSEPVPAEIPESTRNMTLIRFAGKMRRGGADPDEIEAALQVMNDRRCNPPLDTQEVEKIARSSGNYQAGALVPKGEVTWPDLTKDGVPFDKSAANVAAYLAHIGVVVWANEFDGRYYVDGYEGFAELGDEGLRSLRILAEQYKLRTPKDAFIDYVLDLAWQDRRHPVREYLALLHWDKVPRVRTWLATYCSATENPAYVEAVGILVMVAAVQRVRNPGCKFDYMTVLEGAQDIGKSSVWRILSSDTWFTDSLLIGSEPKVVIEQTGGKWLVEIPELDGIAQRDVERVKAMITRQEDGARLAYGRFPRHMPRQFVLVGTTNNAEYLRDETGNRRFLPIRCGRIDLAGMQRARDQLWAEAVVMCDSWREIRLDLPAEIKLLANEAQAARQLPNPVEDKLAEALAHVGAGFVRTEDLMLALGCNRIEEQRRMAPPLSRVMQKLGWRKHKRRDAGKSLNGYHRGGAHAIRFLWNPASEQLIPDPESAEAKYLR